MVIQKDFLRCPYGPQCSLHFPLGEDTRIWPDATGNYECTSIKNNENTGDKVYNCTYLHQLANEDKQTALLEKILIELGPKAYPGPEPFLNDIDHP